MGTWKTEHWQSKHLMKFLNRCCSPDKHLPPALEVQNLRKARYSRKYLKKSFHEENEVFLKVLKKVNRYLVDGSLRKETFLTILQQKGSF